MSERTGAAKISLKRGFDTASKENPEGRLNMEASARRERLRSILKGNKTEVLPTVFENGDQRVLIATHPAVDSPEAREEVL